MSEEHASGHEERFGVDDTQGYVVPPSWPKWIGILTIVYSVLGIGCTGLAAVFTPMVGGMMEPMLDGAPMPEGLKVGPVDWVLLLSGFAMTVVLLFGGIFCLARRPGCRWMFVLYGLVTIPMSLVNYVRQLDKQESIRQWAERYPDTQYAEMVRAQQSGAAAQVGEIVGLGFVLVLGVLIPLFYLIWFGFVKTRREQYEGSESGVY